MVEAVHLLIEIREQVEWFHRNIRASEAALQKAPKVFHTIGVDSTINVLHTWSTTWFSNSLSPLVRLQGISVKYVTRFHVFADFRIAKNDRLVNYIISRLRHRRGRPLCRATSVAKSKSL
jgi:hypothetical protein